MADDTPDYGPLNGLIGVWTGDKGLDISPEPDGTEESPYFETITIEAGGTPTNAESQNLTVLRYHQVVSRKSTNLVFHDQIGYWYWDAERQMVMQSLTIPRAMAVLAGGTYGGEKDDQGRVIVTVSAALGDPDFGVVQSPFMRDNASTISFRHTLKIGDGTLAYDELTVLEIYGRTFDHTDENVLKRSTD